MDGPPVISSNYSSSSSFQLWSLIAHCDYSCKWFWSVVGAVLGLVVYILINSCLAVTKAQSSADDKKKFVSRDSAKVTQPSVCSFDCPSPSSNGKRLRIIPAVIASPQSALSDSSSRIRPAPPTPETSFNSLSPSEKNLASQPGDVSAKSGSKRRSVVAAVDKAKKSRITTATSSSIQTSTATDEDEASSLSYDEGFTGGAAKTSNTPRRRPVAASFDSCEVGVGSRLVIANANAQESTREGSTGGEEAETASSSFLCSSSAGRTATATQNPFILQDEAGWQTVLPRRRAVKASAERHVVPQRSASGD